MPVLRNADHPAVKTPDSVAARYAVAVLGSWAAETATYPFDLTKTRLQIQSEVAAAKHGYKLENHGMIKTAVGIAKQEGILKLWSGLMPMFQRHAIYSGCRLIFYEHFRNMMKDENGKASLGAASLGGLAAGSLAQLIASPTDLVKVQMQAEGRNVLQGKTPRFKNCRQVYAMLYAESGILGFWRGAIPNVQRAALVNMGDLASYDYTKQFLMREFGMADTMLVHAAAAFNAGFVAAVLGTPADVLKTRLMNQPVGPDGRGTLYRGMIDCLQQSVRNEGVLSLYKGFLPLWMRLGPWALINWIAFENIMLAIGGKTF
ncbi:mitochondrial uncoupling protein 4 [Bombyx mandarina]|uniref:Mitochondrial uncoupling protein 4 n=2 Tax=Bombyx TaxID=7090 RepID=A0A8R2M2A3_BOMMO|nr:mitochondrial uncoupling protein 4 [Bombyx mandarina]XP_028043898.1 mitochondrial uncoupling protein 4 [Bombyx mandarina]XP_028043899.1 mitochondrial uncoupling protein 4 [Bombyx mandarina]XP_028043900.1 mitochondrial uncoupling protein 4 [Bombyx mandarina]XP_028043901.1 mitochondrial uncoupling protein 4 [Bombyx mandarina]XP_028043902.1 mitochondrial uncoupling protein 4 [Bombyx mandarina]XP_037872885.1 mitochondrial uncoupling protein 4 [Bombyx mori]XP_037872886.1 mitochondrial uncoupli